MARTRRADAAGAHAAEAPGARPRRARRRPPACARGAYVLLDPPGGHPQAILIATGSEVHVALAAARLLQADRVRVRVVSMPSWELFAAAAARLPRRGAAAGGPRAARRSRRRPRSAGSAGPPTRAPCSRWTGFGASAPGDRLFQEFKFTPERAADDGAAAARAAPHAGPHDEANADDQSAGPARRAGPEPLVRLHHPRPRHDRRAGPADRRGRAPRHDLEPDDLREGDRGQPAVRRRDPRADRAGRSAQEIFEHLAVADVRAACDAFAGVLPGDRRRATAWCRSRCRPRWRTTPRPRSTKPSGSGARSTGPTR